MNLWLQVDPVTRDDAQEISDFSNIFPDEANDFLDYRGQQHLFRIGLNF